MDRPITSPHSPRRYSFESFDTNSTNQLNQYDPKVQQAVAKLQTQNKWLANLIVQCLAGTNEDKLKAGSLLEEAAYHEAAFAIYLDLADRDWDHEAAYRVGVMSIEARGTKRELERAREYLQRSELDCAKYELVQLYYHEQYFGIKAKKVTDIAQVNYNQLKKFTNSIDETLAAKANYLMGVLIGTVHPDILNDMTALGYSFNANFARGYLEKAVKSERTRIAGGLTVVSSPKGCHD